MRIRLGGICDFQHTMHNSSSISHNRSPNARSSSLNDEHTVSQQVERSFNTAVVAQRERCSSIHLSSVLIFAASVSSSLFLFSSLFFSFFLFMYVCFLFVFMYDVSTYRERRSRSGLSATIVRRG